MIQKVVKKYKLFLFSIIVVAYRLFFYFFVITSILQTMIRLACGMVLLFSPDLSSLSHVFLARHTGVCLNL